jgi:intracellular septation protein A
LFNPYTKAIIAALVAFLGSLASAFDDSIITTSEILVAVGIGIAALGAVWAAHKTIKWLISGVLAGFGSLSLALQDDRFSAQEIITVGLAVLIALTAVYETANTEASSQP